MGHKPKFLFEYCVAANQWGLKSVHESCSADGNKAFPLVLAYSQFESLPSYNFLGIFASHKSKGRSSKEFPEAGKKRLAGDTTREATAPEVHSMKTENEALKQLVAELSLENRLLKKRWSATAA